MTRALALASSFALAFSFALATAHASPELRTDGAYFRDRAGRVVLLRGVNLGGDAKVPPFRALPSEALLDPLPGWGVNAVRLLFTWEAYEPSPGQYDDAYLAYLRGAAHAAWARGLFVVVDFHQDEFSRFAARGCGDGFPKWALPPTVTPAAPDNGAACANWGAAMLSDPDLPKIWSAFYADQFGARSAYLAMVARVAAALAGEPGVVGYDLLNEPGGDEATEIAPLYQDAAKAIRAADPTAILFVSPAALTSAGVASKLPKPSFANFAYAPHYYDPAVFLLKAWSGSDEAAPFDRMAGQAAAFGAPLFVGEFGAPPSTDQVDGYLAALWAQLDARLASGAQWAYTPGWTDAAKDGWNREDFSIVDGSGAARANFRARAYPQRIAGAPERLAVTDGADGALALTWAHDPAAGATVIYAPASAFAADAIAVDAGGDLACATMGALVTCTAPTAGEKRVRVTAAAPPPAGSCGLTGIEPLALIALALLLRQRRAARR